MKNKIWFVTRSQITAADIESAIIPVDPEQLPDGQIANLHGAVSLRIEGAKGMADIMADPATRKFFRMMHARWPWSGFFLAVNPITADSPADQMVDLSVFVSLILVHVDQVTYCETPRGITLRYNALQFHKHLAELQSRAAELAAAVDMPLPAISQRAILISRAIGSFFAAGQELNQSRKQNPKKRK
jgi:hypothetical protein